ncbi:MAG: sigma-54-dependent Fis family transcriptional regulator [Acidobacteria bacterium]|nr:sigma-54-dependent Fis family transcriptional regulator [Acidobacteriota bacterium]
MRCVEQASGGAEALGYLESGAWQVLFLDRSLPDLNAEELSHTIRQRFPMVEIVLLDSEADSDVAALPEERVTLPPRKPPNVEKLMPARAVVVNAILQAPLPGMIGGSRKMQPVYRGSRLMARRDTTVLITGPTGSGKELVARAIHDLSARSARAFVVINCAAIPEALLESELFGHTRGAFTGAMQSYSGRIQMAQGGTLFLDEIGDMPLSLQPKLLRFLEQKEVQRLGSCEVLRVDARVIAATNARLLSLVQQGKFREDLYYRLCAFPIEIPPLRERPDDILELAQHFLDKFSLRPPAPELSPEGAQLLRSHPWAGNVRELQNVIERSLILAEDEMMIRPEHMLMPEDRAHG